MCWRSGYRSCPGICWSSRCYRTKWICSSSVLEEEGESSLENELLPLREEDMMDRRLISSVLPAKGVSCLLDFIPLESIYHRLLNCSSQLFDLFPSLAHFRRLGCSLCDSSHSFIHLIYRTQTSRPYLSSSITKSPLTQQHTSQNHSPSACYAYHFYHAPYPPRY